VVEGFHRFAASIAAALALASSSAHGAEPDTNRYEPGILPVVAGDTDVGLKLGAFAQLARFQGDVRPYAWRGQVLGAVSVREGPTGTESPYREAYLRLDVPHAAYDSLRLRIELSYLRTTNRGYYGLGNASEATQKWAGLEPGSDAYVTARRYYQYDGATPALRIAALAELGPAWSFFGDVSLAWTKIAVYPGSLLEHDVAAGLVRGVSDRFQPAIQAGFVHDTRDHETVPTSGQWHDASVRCSPGFGRIEAWCGANLTLRGYVPIAGRNLSLAGRLLGDVVSARAPLIALSTYGGMEPGTGLGGSASIRGVPQGRLQGRTKLIGNFEIRSLFLPFSIGDQRFELGAAALGDVGRVLVDPLRAVQPLDGPTWTLHWGVGAGPRLRWGDALLIRCDFAYAPLGRELGTVPALYVDVDAVL
jgi:hypothetical protein